jgi:hypothetical protein
VGHIGKKIYREYKSLPTPQKKIVAKFSCLGEFFSKQHENNGFGIFPPQFQKGKKKSYVNLGHHLEHEFLEYLRIYQIQNSQCEVILQKTKE